MAHTTMLRQMQPTSRPTSHSYPDPEHFTSNIIPPWLAGRWDTAASSLCSVKNGQNAKGRDKAYKIKQRLLKSTDALTGFSDISFSIQIRRNHVYFCRIWNGNMYSKYGCFLISSDAAFFRCHSDLLNLHCSPTACTDWSLQLRFDTLLLSLLRAK